MGRAFEFRKERKFKRWAAMSKTFTRIGKDIVIAVKEGGPSPESNSRLRAIIQNAKAANMPKDNVERAIKKASSKDQADYKEVVYEGYAPYGVAVLIETATDNTTRTVANIRAAFNKNNGSLGTSGSVDFMFEHKCYFKIVDKDYDVEELELELIDYGVEEVFREPADEDEEEKPSIMLYGLFQDYGSIQKAIEEKGFEVVNSGFERIPTDVKKLTPEQEAEVDKLIERLEEDDDVQAVYTNMA
ncbi:MAG: YebC/PmpR family DNA-binding transcriptional regulator [Luteibaculaceae bacterium]